MGTDEWIHVVELAGGHIFRRCIDGVLGAARRSDQRVRRANGTDDAITTMDRRRRIRVSGLRAASFAARRGMGGNVGCGAREADHCSLDSGFVMKDGGKG